MNCSIKFRMCAWLYALACISGVAAEEAGSGTTCHCKPMAVAVTHAGSRATTNVSQTSSLKFVMQTVTINVGDTVTWTNTAGFTHTTTSDTLVWDSGNMSSGAVFSFTFNQAGTFPYHCSIHGSPGAGMFGTVIVTAPEPGLVRGLE